MGLTCGLDVRSGPDEVHWLTAAKIELKMQPHRSPLFGIGHYEPDRSAVFRRSTDPISAETQALLDAYGSKL